jgi:hypothetical protein
MIARLQLIRAACEQAPEERNFDTRGRIDRGSNRERRMTGEFSIIMNFEFSYDHPYPYASLVMKFVRRVINLDPRGSLSSFSRASLVNLTDCRTMG